mgnify:CR=1 FL=1
MNTLQVKTVSSNQLDEVGYLLINKAARAMAIVNPISQMFNDLDHYKAQNYSIDWVLLTHPPFDDLVLLELKSQFTCVIASSLPIIEQLTHSLSAYCEPLENHEVVMLGHLELEAIISREFVNYKINDHIFLYDCKNIETRELEKLARTQNRFVIHLVHFNESNIKLGHEVSPFELMRLIN